MTKQQRRKTYV